MWQSWLNVIIWRGTFRFSTVMWAYLV